MISFKEFIEALDEICAAFIIFTGVGIAIYMFLSKPALLTDHWGKITTLIGIGSGYLFGKSVPKKPKE